MHAQNQKIAAHCTAAGAAARALAAPDQHAPPDQPPEKISSGVAIPSSPISITTHTRIGLPVPRGWVAGSRGWLPGVASGVGSGVPNLVKVVRLPGGARTFLPLLSFPPKEWEFLPRSHTALVGAPKGGPGLESPNIIPVSYWWGGG